MKNYIYPCLLAAAASLASCVDDKGSYTLSPINEVEITLSNEDGYVAYLAGDPVHISADVTGTMAETNEPSRYAYHWYVKIITNLSSTASETIDLSEEREFDYVADGSLLPGSYTLYLEVTDLETGLKTIQQSSLAVLSQMTTGYLVLGENTDGTVKMDMITTMEEDTILLEDVFTDPNIREPESLVFIGQTRYGEYQNLWLTAADQSYSLTNGSYFELLEDNTLDSKMLTTFDVKRPMRVIDMFPRYDASYGCRGDSKRGYITDDAIYVTSMMSNDQIFGNPINRYSNTSTELFTPYRLAFVVNGAYMSSLFLNAIFYDMDSQAFVGPNSNSPTSATYCRKLQASASAAFEWDQSKYPDNRRLVFGQNGNAGYSYVVLTDDQNKWYAYSFKPSSTTSPSQWFSTEIDQSVATDFAQASHYAFSDDETEMVYAVGSKLYGYDLERNIGRLLKDYGSEIILLDRDAESTTARNKFYIAVSAGDGKSTLSWFTIPSDPNDIPFEEDEDMVWEINSTVKGIQWKSAGDLADESGYY